MPGPTAIFELFSETRALTEKICSFLEPEDFVVQPITDVSPPKWHLGHTSWFFEEFVLKKQKEYVAFHKDFSFIFNSYYESVGEKVLRPDRGNLSRPTVKEILDYRHFITEKVQHLLLKDSTTNKDLEKIIELGIHHEKQHQELLYTDIKYILGTNPLFPVYNDLFEENSTQDFKEEWITIKEGIYEIGHKAPDQFCFDNELTRHKVYLQEFEISNKLVTNAEYLQFMQEEGYAQTSLWHSEAWEWLKSNPIQAPLYWHYVDGEWHQYTLKGLKKLDPSAPVSHISYYEAFAFSQWKGMRLPTEFEWETAEQYFKWGSRWEWTESAYLPYPGYSRAAGALGEYNGKFMVNQKVLRGSSVATAPRHVRPTYRNFFHPHLRWQFTGIRLVK